MVIEWIVLCLLGCFIAVSYFKGYKLKIRILFVLVLMLISLILVLPMFSFSLFTLAGLFLFESLWILLGVVLIIEAFINRNNRIIRAIFAGISIAVYFFLRRFI